MLHLALSLWEKSCKFKDVKLLLFGHDQIKVNATGSTPTAQSQTKPGVVFCLLEWCDSILNGQGIKMCRGRGLWYPIGLANPIWKCRRQYPMFQAALPPAKPTFTPRLNMIVQYLCFELLLFMSRVSIWVSCVGKTQWNILIGDLADEVGGSLTFLWAVLFSKNTGEPLSGVCSLTALVRSSNWMLIRLMLDTH